MKRLTLTLILLTLLLSAGLSASTSATPQRRVPARTPAMLLSEVRVLASAACRCKTTACLRQVNRRVGQWVRANGHNRLSQADKQQFVRVLDRYTMCARQITQWRRPSTH